MTVKTFFITGVSSRLGRALAVGAPSVGHTVVGTVRKPDDITSFEDLAPGLGHGVVLDVTDDQSVFSLAADVERLQAVLPQMRKRHRGHLIAVTSMGGFDDRAGRSMVRAAHTIDDYDEVFGPIRQARLEANGNQLGDPVKAAEPVLQIIDVAEPSKHLVLGTVQSAPTSAPGRDARIGDIPSARRVRARLASHRPRVRPRDLADDARARRQRYRRAQGHRPTRLGRVAHIASPRCTRALNDVAALTDRARPRYASLVVTDARTGRGHRWQLILSSPGVP